MLITIWILLFISACVASENCTQVCRIIVDDQVDPCPTIFKTDCKQEYPSIEEGNNIKVQVREFYFRLVDSTNSTCDCYGVSIMQHPNGIHHRGSQNNNIVYKNKDNNNPKGMVIDCSNIDERKNSNKIRKYYKAIFKNTERILKIRLNDEFRGNYSLTVERTIRTSIILTISKKKAVYLKIPDCVERLEWKLKLSNSLMANGNFSFSDTSLIGDFSETPNCVHVFPENWNFSTSLISERVHFITANIRSSIPCFDVKKYNVRLFTNLTEDSLCDGKSGNKISQQDVAGSAFVTVKFNISSPGRYCIRLTPIDGRCENECPRIYSGIVAVELAPDSIQKIQPDEWFKGQRNALYVGLIISSVLLIAVGTASFCLRKRICSIFNFRTLQDEEPPSQNEDTLDSKMRAIKETSKQTILLLRCNENEKINRDIDHFVKFLEECCFCEVLHAKEVSARVYMSDTSPGDWLAEVMKKSSITIVIVTKKTYNFYYPANYKDEGDPNFCVFSDRTSSIGIQILKHCQDIKRLFARFCYTEDIRLSELTDDIIEIPQALVYLFHCIHQKKSLVCEEMDLIDYWLANKSFKHLYHLKQNPYETSQESKTTSKSQFIDLQRNPLDQNSVNVKRTNHQNIQQKQTVL